MGALEELANRALSARAEGALRLEGRHISAIERLSPEAQNTLLALLVHLEGRREGKEVGKSAPPFGGALVSNARFAVWPISRLGEEAQHVLAWVLEEWGATR